MTNGTLCILHGYCRCLDVLFYNEEGNVYDFNKIFSNGC